MDFSLAEEHVMLKTSARSFLDTECPKKLVREMADDADGYSKELWKKMANLGWQGLVIPEEYGGVGSSFLDLAVLLEEMGRALVPGPFLPTVVLVGRPILAAGTSQQKQEFLPGIAAGEKIATLALLESEGSFEAAAVTVTARAAADGFTINGTKMFVPDAHVADLLLVVARTKDGAGKADGVSLLLVDARADGVKTEVLTTMTGEKLCEVTFSDVSVAKDRLLGELDKGWPIVERILVEAAVAECAWMVGGAGWVMEASVEYAKERLAFDKPIGSFQAIAHRCANMAIDIEGALSITYYAAWSIAEEDPELSVTASVAKAWCTDMYKSVAGGGIQVHGAIGFAWEHDVTLFFRRAKTSELAYGDADYHREKVAAYVTGEAAP
jgi:alkylation response protein AidB-like acyl-CoA dehydrogenase